MFSSYFLWVVYLVHSFSHCTMGLLLNFVIFPSAKDCLLEGSPNCYDITPQPQLTMLSSGKN